MYVYMHYAQFNALYEDEVECAVSIAVYSLIMYMESYLTTTIWEHVEYTDYKTAWTIQ